MKILDVKPQQAWMVGDDLKRDIAGAKQAEIYAIWCDYENKGLPEGSNINPDKIIRDIAELLSL